MGKTKKQGQLIIAVEPGSIAADLGLCPGDRLLRLNGEPVKDVFAYRLQVLEEELLLEIRKADQTEIAFEIEKDADELLGLEFEDPLMDQSRHCHNRCLFCFIDQLPPGLRETLYFKDDDLRLSFLTGNYVTLTNLDDEELDRLIAYHLSPMNVSVHTTNPELRRFMMANPRSVKIMEQLRRIAAAGIEINCQIVLCPGLNDGCELERTLEDLETLGERLSSVAVVPVGLTKFREANGLPLLQAVDRTIARQVLEQTAYWQTRFQKRYGRRIFYAADEFYLRAEQAIPPLHEYEDCPQLENGVGMLALQAAELEAGLRRRGFPTAETGEDLEELPEPPRSVYGRWSGPVECIHLLTGCDAAPGLEAYRERLESLYPTKLCIHAIPNTFFGERITVAGLLTGQDLLAKAAEVSGSVEREVFLIPDCMLRAGEDVFLDDRTPQDLVTRTGKGLVVGRTGGFGLLQALDFICGSSAEREEDV